MKKIFLAKISFLPVILIALTLITSSCEKDTDGSPENKPGTPVLKSVEPAQGSGGAVVTVTGTGLGDIQTIVFDKNSIPTAVTSTLNTSTHILFRVPTDAYGGDQNIILTNSKGKTLSVPFNVVALPIVNTAFPTDFQAGSTVTITGNNLDDVSEVIIEGTTDAATIVSQTRKSLVLTMPTSTADKGKLVLTNLSGKDTTSFTFVNIDRAAKVFTDQFDSGFQSWSWGGAYTSSTDDFITGTSSLKCVFEAKKSWGGLQLGGGNIDLTGYRYFAFWIKGGTADIGFNIWLNWAGSNTFTAPAGKWTYFQFDLLTTAGWTGLGSVNNVCFQIQGGGETVYIDNITFIK